MIETSTGLHVVLGSGQIGTRLTHRLLQQGQRVRVVSLHGRTTTSNPALEVLAGDMTNLTFAEQATHGAQVVYDCMNPPYHEWPRLLLALGRGALHGAVRANAKLVALDCLYMYGAPAGPISETTPLAPCSKKGELRVQLAKMRLDALSQGNAQVCIGRASDFIGPNLPFSCWNPRFFQRVLAGKAGECMGDPDLPHSYTFADDIAEALLRLGASSETGVWHLPTAPAETSRQVTARLGQALGLDAQIKAIPRSLLKAIGWFSPFMREVEEMAYQWRVPFVIDDAKFVARFGQSATPLDRAVSQTAAWAKATFTQAAHLGQTVGGSRHTSSKG